MQPSLNAVNPRVNTNATVRRNQGEETMTTALTHRILTALTSTIAALVILGTPVLSQGATITWMAYSDWNWDGATANWADGGAVAFSSGDVTQFVRGTSPAGTVAIQAGGVDPRFNHNLGRLWCRLDLHGWRRHQRHLQDEQGQYGKLRP